jgi:hypothetical protein
MDPTKWEFTAIAEELKLERKPHRGDRPEGITTEMLFFQTTILPS